MNDYIIYWLMPSIITLIFLVPSMRFTKGRTSKNYDNIEWATIVICSILYPLGIFIFIADIIIPFIMKEWHK